MRSRLALIIALASTSPAVAHAQSLDVEGWLRRPGVRMVAVEFYARWCQPCLDAVPRWRALHEKYKDEGLRLIVVSTQDPGGILHNPGWSPDEIVADDSGAIANALGAGSKLPAAFLWSWNGKLLAQHARIEDVEKEIDRWMRDTPRVDVRADGLAASTGVGAEQLRDLVRERLRDEDKLYVVATKEERDALDRLKLQSFNARYDEGMQCELGKELPASSLLDVRITGTALSLMLLSVERGCLVAASSVPWNAKKAKVSVAEAVSGLMTKIRATPEMPGAKRSEPPKADPPPPPPPQAKVAVVEPPKPPPPETKPKTVVVTTQSELRIMEQIYFDTGKASIKPISFAALDGIARTLKDHAEITKLTAECHTDNRGADSYNKKLTQDRAQAIVTYLVRVGIDPARLGAIGYGEEKPIADNTTEKGRAQNRRCEFQITR